MTAGPGAASPVVWIEQYGASTLTGSGESLIFGPEATTAITTDSSGDVVVGGYVAGSFTGFTGEPGVLNAYLAKYGPDGNRLWLKEFGVPDGLLLFGLSTDSSGNIYGVGTVFTTGPTLASVAVFKTDPDGNQQWEQVLPAQIGPFFQSSLGEEIRVEPDGSVLAAGVGYVAGTPDETLFATKLNAADGLPLWFQAYPSVNINLFSGMTLDGSGNPIVCGLFFASDSTIHGYVAKANQADGSLVWAVPLTPPSGYEIPWGLTTDAAGDALVGGGEYNGNLALGFSADPKEQAVLTQLSGDTGDRMWQQTYTTGKGDVITGVETSAKGTIFAVGYTNGHFNSFDQAVGDNIFLLTLSSQGDFEEAHQFGNGPVTGATVLFGPQTAADTSGDIFVGGATTGAYPGFSNPGNALQMFVAKLKPYDPQS